MTLCIRMKETKHFTVGICFCCCFLSYCTMLAFIFIFFNFFYFCYQILDFKYECAIIKKNFFSCTVACVSVSNSFSCASTTVLGLDVEQSVPLDTHRFLF